jgi:hypothetical protein
VPNTTISSSAVNSDFSDIATALTDSIAADGQTPITSPLKALNGTLNLPAWTFSADDTSGLYLEATGNVGLVAGGFGIQVNSTGVTATEAVDSAPGTLYAVGDLITLTGGTAVKQTILQVATLSGSGVATVTIVDGGLYTTAPANPVSQGSTTGLGSGATFTLTTGAADLISNASGTALWQLLGSTSYMAAAMVIPNGLQLANYIGASNIAAAIGLSAAPPGSSFKNLAIKVATTTTCTLSADFIVVTNGTAYQTLAFNQSINLGTTGANALDTGTIAIDTWYYIWAIAQPNGTVAGLASASSTTPTMPSGYTYKARVGAIQTIHSTATLYGSWQFGRKAQYVIGLASTAATPLIVSGVIGSYDLTSPTLASITVTGNGKFVPTTAASIRLVAFTEYKGGSNGRILITPSAAYSGLNNGPVGSNGMIYPYAFDAAATLAASSGVIEILLESSAIYAATNNNGPAIGCLGWEDNL